MSADFFELEIIKAHPKRKMTTVQGKCHFGQKSIRGTATHKRIRKTHQ
jgi:hypothetical protein